MYKFTNNQYEMRNVDIDLRKDASLLTDEFGINVLYVRNCKFVRCKCFDDLNKTGDPNCPLCFGAGYFASIQKLRAIESSISPYSSKNNAIQTSIGVTNQKYEVYYLRHMHTPKERDMILKVTWDKNGNPVDVLKVLEVVNVYEMRGDDGRVELNGCVTDDRTDLVQSYTTFLRKLPKKAVAELLKGGKYIWPIKLKN